MGILSPNVSITRYRVQGRVGDPVLDNIKKNLKKFAISAIYNDAAERSSGWTSFEKPYKPDFDGSSYVFGAHLVFSLRIDKKSIPSKIIKKHYAIEETKRLTESGRPFISRNEKKLVKEQILHSLSLRIPATPNIYNLVWDYEKGSLWFFTNLKAANEELETLFTESFKLSLIRFFPYTAAEFDPALTDAERDRLNRVSAVTFAG